MRRGKKVLLLLGSVSFMLLMAEGILRLFPLLRPLPQTYVGEYENRPLGNGYLVADSVLGWRMPAGAQLGNYRANSQGFRAAVDFSSNPGCRIIAFAGDSFTFGPGVRVEQTFASVVQTNLAASCAYNMGVPGFGLDQIWQTVRTQALPLHPALVVVSFISGDFTRSQDAYRPMEGFNKPTFKLVDGRLLARTAADRPGWLAQFLESHSSVWRVLCLADRAIAHHYTHGEWWNLNAAILEAIRADCRAAGVPIIFIYIPSREWGTFPALRDYMDRRGANFIDLSRGPYALTPDMYISAANGHLNPKGHQQVAAAVVQWMENHPSTVVNASVQ
ncbi:MAG: SGNH/GDSL hydrolase family protein [Candidatus Korobacteraceae bacterium]